MSADDQNFDIFRCVWKTEDLEKEYIHKSEVKPDSILFAPELDYDYYYAEDPVSKVSKAEALTEDEYDYYDNSYDGDGPLIQVDEFSISCS